MERQIILKDTQIKELVRFYEEKEQTLKGKMIELNNEINDIIELLKPLKESLKDHVELSEKEKQMVLYNENEKNIPFNSKWSKAKKAEWALRVSGVKLSIRQIIEKIGNQEPHLFKGDLDKTRDFLTQLSATLGVKSKNKNIFYRERNDKSLFEYGLLDWK